MVDPHASGACFLGGTGPIGHWPIKKVPTLRLEDDDTTNGRRNVAFQSMLYPFGKPRTFSTGVLSYSYNTNSLLLLFDKG